MSQVTSPFHRGEQEAQSRVGVRERAEQLGQQMVRDHMPDQHREFYQKLPVVFVGSVDEHGQPWASVVVGKPGFMNSPDARKLRLNTSLLPHDPLSRGLRQGAQLGLLGLEFHSRRRNRMNGKVTSVTESGFEMRVGQSFGNCPQYIQKRQLKWHERGEARLVKGTRMSAEVKALIESSDTFFIASTFDQQGTDVSHRGGKPGFVKVEDDQTFVFPDFRGNNHFNTVGNLLVNPKAGLLFFNYQTGDVLYLTTRSEIVWDGAEVQAFDGAQRLVRFRVLEWRLVKSSFPFSWDFQEFSPSLNTTGQWEASLLRAYRVTRIEQESRAIKSFYLAPLEGEPPEFKPGQHLPIQIPRSPGEEPTFRTYSLSQAPGMSELRLTVKREKNGVGSGYLHDIMKVGEVLHAQTPAGEFFLQSESERPVILLSAGVGITPMLSMLSYLAKARPEMEVHFLHGARTGADHVLRSEVESLKSPQIHTHFRYSRAHEGDEFDSQGRIDSTWLRSVLPFGNYDFYLCGPAPFLKSLYHGLEELGVSTDQIHFETFGGSVELEKVVERDVEFRASGKMVKWQGGTLLELAERNGISAPFSCRTGACGSCSRGLISGDVEYSRKPSFEIAEGEALLCSARPCSEEMCDTSLVIDL